MWNLVTTAAALLILIPMLGNVTRHAGETTADAAVCHQLATTAALRDAAVAYVIANHASLGIGAGATASLAPSTLIAAGQLPTSWQDRGPYDTTHAVRVRNNGAGYDVLTVTHGGNPLDERRLRASATCAAQGLAYVDSDSPGTIITASQGDRISVANFDSAAAPIEAGRLMYLDHVGAGQVVPPYLHRYEVPGTDANRMFTAIDMAANDINNARTVNTDTLNAGDANVSDDLAVGDAATIGGLLSGTDAQFSGDVYATNYWHLSDRREKTDIKDVVCKPAEELRRLLPKEYRWRATGERKISYIAQDVQAVLPEFVRTDPRGRLVVMQSELNLYVMRCLLEPSLEKASATEVPPDRACSASVVQVTGTRLPGQAAANAWRPFSASLPNQASGTGAWASPADGEMDRYCPRLWVACVDGERTYTCRRPDRSLSSHPIVRPMPADGGAS